MDQPYWLRQTDKALFPALEWSRPETKLQAGKLLIIGGTLHGFAAPAEAYGKVLSAGVGTVRVILPDSLRQAVGKLFPAADFVPSTPSGSFATNALAELLDASAWADGLLIPGDISRNSETTVLVETLLEKYQGQVTFTKDAADIFVQQPFHILQRPGTLLVLAQGQLRQLASEARFARAFTSDMGLVALVSALHEFTKRFTPYIVTRYQDYYVVAVNGQVSTTKLADPRPVWRLTLAATASVWWLQTPKRPFEALTTAAHNCR